MSRLVTARHAVEIFFPLRPVLRIDGHAYSETIQHRILHLAGVTASFDVAAMALEVAGEIAISDRQVNKLVVESGAAMAKARDARTTEYVEQNLPRRVTQPETPISLAVVYDDGGRMRTRCPKQGTGVHEPHWRETKNAGFCRMKTQSFAVDPKPTLPDSFCNQAYVEKLVRGLKSQKNQGREEQDASAEEAQPEPTKSAEPNDWQPELLFRTCLSSLASSDKFGAMMAAEADARGLFAAEKGAFLGDGGNYNWSIQRRWFPTFVPIADFVHVIEYVYSAAKACHAEPAACWEQYLLWATAVWQGRVEDVRSDLRAALSNRAPLIDGEKLSDGDPRKTIQTSLTYFTNNRERMKYPDYRREGLPVTSSLAESLVKQMNWRVKGTEKFWNDGPSAEAILQVRAAIISDDDRLKRWVHGRSISPFSPRCRSRERQIAA
jgi:hypothetical protein